MPPLSLALLIGPLIDDTITWFAAWHRLAFAQPEIRRKAAPLLEPPPSFLRWRENAQGQTAHDQPAIEKLSATYEQMLKLAKLILLKAGDSTALDSTDDDDVTAKYLAVMRGLRRLERIFSAAAAELDPLTGLHTRAGLIPDLDREIKRSARSKRPFCIALMDIDHFKKVNDTYGHEVGDKVLASVANQISRGLRAHDDGYRFGGEEFILSLKEVDLTAGMLVLERLRVSLEQTPVTLPEGIILPITASFGLTESTDASTPEDLLKRADEALYRAKDKGRNRVVIG